ncbi:hypothetical protein SSS_07293 [Sarcoptes scabiei]|uniref:Uncharacterized protein n=1 Tax=Sarcoptes scabiei TaxID=52283 RepID=A0A834R4R7_SARSC|nr:hypothetical protein SSS_07293 [Sarcoptes scabiei]
MEFISRPLLNNIRLLPRQRSFRLFSIEARLRPKIDLKLNTLPRPASLKEKNDVFGPDKAKCVKSFSINDELDEIFFTEYLTNELNLKPFEVKQIFQLFGDEIRENYPRNKSLIDLCVLLKSIFTVEDLQWNQKPFRTSFETLTNQIFMLKEIGFRSFHISMLDSIEDILMLNDLQLKQYLNFPLRKSSFDSICKILSIENPLKKELRNDIEESYKIKIESIPVAQIRIQCVAYYLMSRFKINLDHSMFICLKYQSDLNRINLHTMLNNIDFLQKKFHYSSKKITQNALFLFVKTKNLLRIYEDLSRVIGPDLYRSSIKLSKLLRTDFDQIVRNYNLVKQKCNNHFPSKADILLTYSTEHLTEIFNEIEQHKELRFLKLEALGLDFLVINRHQIYERIAKIKAEQLPTELLPLRCFKMTKKEFESYLNELISDSSQRIKLFLKQRFDLNYDDLKHRIHHFDGCDVRQYTIENSNRIVEFLISINVDKDLIIEFIHLIFFDFKQIKEAFHHLKSASPNESIEVKDREFILKLIDYLLANNKTINVRAVTTSKKAGRLKCEKKKM